MNSAATVLVLGARGRLGRAAVQAFSRAGWPVVGQLRPGAHALPMAGVRWVGADPEDTAALLAAAPEASVIVHALNPMYTQDAWRTQAPRMLEAAIRLGRALKATLLLPGNVYNFGENLPALLQVDTAQQSAGVMGQVRIAMEQGLSAAARDGGLQAVVVRAGDFFGSGRGAWLDQAVAKDLRSGRVTWPAGLDAATPWAYLPDLAEALVRVARRRDRLPGFSHLHFAGHAVTGQQWVDVLTAVAREEGWLSATQALRVRTMPWTLFRVLGPLVPTFAALAEMRYLWRTPHRLDNRELCELIGAEPRTPFEDAVRRSLRELGITAATPVPSAVA